jgi:hypothetical protein
MESVMIRGKDMEKSTRRNESVQQGLQDQPHATEPPDVLEPAGLGVNLTANTLENKIKGDLNMPNKQEAQEYKATNNCQVDAETRVNLLQHLDEHGPASLLTSNKFSQYAGCFPEEITSAIAAESALKASAAADDPIGTQDAAASTADDATESPAAMRARFQSRRSVTGYRQGRI